MPRIKQPPVTPTTSLSGFSLAFADLKRASIPLRHDDLANKTFTQLEDEVQQAGGSVVTKIGPDSCTHLVATGEQYHKKGARIKEAIKHNIPIVIYDWLAISLASNDAVDVADFLLQSNSSPSPASEEVAQTNGRSSRSGKRALDDEGDGKDASNGIIVKKIKAEDEDQKDDIKGPPTMNGTKTAQKPKIQVPVDEHYPEQRCKVYQDDQGVVYDATLNQTESGKNANKFYRVQLLQHNSGQFYTWTRWGRVGDVPGQSKMLGDGHINLAIAEFEKKFKDKTGLAWKDRDATPKSKKYTMIEINYEESDGDDDLPGAGPRRDSHVSSASSESVETKLSEPVARLMSLIFNNDFFNSTLADLDYDANKMPLGKLSKKTLLKGYEVLKDLASRIGQIGPAPGEQANVTSLSDQYFSLIPHAFHRGQRPPILASMELIKKEVTLLENLTDMQLANEIMKTAKNEKVQQGGKLALVDRQYQGLGMQEMTPLDSKGSEYKELADYLIKSAGNTHYIRYEVQDIFRIERQNEGNRFKKSKFAKLPKGKSDRRLLWHGSRTTNYGGILSQGLRIAPPEAPVSGYMFGKGIYLADISTKSANYCNHYSSGNTGLLLLCEAELGAPSLRLTDAAYDANEKAEKQGCISTWGIGQTTPKGWKDASCVHPDLEGVIMPDVKEEPGPSNIPGAYLMYDEFICYAVEQVRLRYLLRVKMT